MQEQVSSFLQNISGFVWGWPLLILLVGTGVFLTVRLKILQFWALPHSLWLALIKRKEESPEPGEITHFQALMTALAATIGTGNIAGVATAIAAGGPGALFWMWITGFFGMATKYAEAILAVKYRVVHEDGTVSGGPMYYLANGLKQKWLAVLFSLFAAVAAFGIGNMVQSNSVADALKTTFSVPHYLTGIILTLATGLVLIGGIKSIAKITQWLVPLMIVLYGGAALAILIVNIKAVPHTVALIFQGAFAGQAMIGGFAGAVIKKTIQYGVARGVFSNESGMGSAPIAAAAAKTKNPATQALVSMTQTFIDTIVVCSLTGFAIISSGVWSSGLDGAALTVAAFSQSLPGDIGGIIVSVGLCLFAYSTLLGWSYYGEKSIEYLVGKKIIVPYRLIFTLVIALGAMVKLDIVWTFSDIMNGLMAVPNLIAVLGLSGVVVIETNKYFSKNNS